MYKRSKPRYSSHFGYEVIDILKRERLFNLIPYWSHHSTIKNAGQADEVVFLLNNPEELTRRLNEAAKNFSSNDMS